MGVVSPCSMTHWLGVQGKASGSSIPAVTNRPIRMQGSAMRHHLRPCTQRGVWPQVLRGESRRQHAQHAYSTIKMQGSARLFLTCTGHLQSPLARQ